MKRKDSNFTYISFAIFFTSFFLSVNFATAQNCPLVCNDQVNVSLGEDCWIEITPDMVLEAPGSNCNYVVEVYDPFGNPIGDIVDGEYVNMTLDVKVYLGATHCWGTIYVMDEIAPVIQCPSTLTLLCNDEDYTGDPDPIVSDNCDGSPEIVVISDNLVDLPCSNQYSAQRTITFKAVDASGNESALCTQVINFQRVTTSSVSFPLNRDGIQSPALECDNASGWDLNNNNYPDPEESGVPAIGGSPIYPNNTFCEIEATYSDQTIDICNGMYKILRNWTILNWCLPVTPGQNPINQIQIIQISDNVAPEVSCPGTLNLGSDFGDCGNSVLVPHPTMYDNCGTVSYTVTSTAGSVSFNGSQYIITDAPSNPFYITYNVSDDCGNVNSCSSQVIINDIVPPVPICDVNTIASLGGDGYANIYWQTFDDGSYDNCGIDKIQVRRNTGCGLNDGWRDYVRFCCEDILNSPIVVEMGVWDLAGNFNSCYVNVLITDNLPPGLTGPPNITVSCDYPIDLWDLSDFGSVVLDPADVQPIFIDDVNYPNGYAGQDGYAYDNCNAVVSVDVVPSLECGQGVIKRIFTATDDYGSSSNYIQYIYIEDYDPFNISDISWPDDFIMNTCNVEGTSPDYTGSPNLGDDGCSLVAATYEDQVFTLVPDACFKIIRKWTVIDWCQYDPDVNPDQGYWTQNQVIKVKNSEAPVFEDCSDKIICNADADGCQGLVSLAAQADDDCTPKELLIYTFDIDIDNNGSFEISGNGNVYANYFSYGTHKVLWTVEDLCGNTETCSYTFEVKDCKKPSPVCHNGLSSVIMPSSGTIALHAIEFDASSFDNCTSTENLTFSYSSDIADSIRTFTCESLGFQPVEIWVTDEAGNQDFCETFITLQDPNGICGGTTNSLVSGSYSTANMEPINGVNSTLEAELPGFPLSQNSGASNYFAFYNTDSITEQSFTLIPTKLDDPLNGISTYDLYLMQLHILGIQALEGPYNIIAADVNNDQKITVIDIIELRNVLLGNKPNFENTNPWVFVSPLYKFADFDVPFGYPEEVSFVYETTGPVFSITGVKIGDVNNSYSAENLILSEDRSNRSFTLSAIAKPNEKGTLVSFYADKRLNLSSIQLALDFSQEINVVNLVGHTLPLSKHNIGLNDQDQGQVKLSYFSPTGIEFSAEEMLFSIQLNQRNISSISLDEAFTEIIDLSGENWEVAEIQMKQETIVGNRDQSVVSISPNPFSTQTKIQFVNTLGEKAKRMRIFDVSGKLVSTLKLSQEFGKQEFSLNAELLDGDGMYYYQIETTNSVISGRFIMLD